MRSLVLALALGLVVPTTATARTWHISVDGQGDAPTVQAGIDSASTGDVVLVGPGTYLENLDFLGKDITLKSELGPEVTVLDGSSRDSSVVVFKRGETRAAVLEGFTITGGTGSRSLTGGAIQEGGGIRCYLGSPTIRGNRIVNNRTEYTFASGGGLLAGTGFPEDGPTEPLIEGNFFAGNDAGSNGGAVGIKAPCEGVLRRNVFLANHCRADGGAVWVYLYVGSVVIEENQFLDNVAGDHGGGLYAQTSHGEPFTILRNTFVRNRTVGTGFFGDTGSGGAIAALRIRGTIAYNTVVDNDGSHLTHCGGGGLLLFLTTLDLVVTNNIFVLNRECGIACWQDGTATMGPNLLWFNSPSDLGVDLGLCPSVLADEFVIADPMFCNSAVDDYRVSADSPALANGQVLGAYPVPGCGPEVPAHPTTWGQIKARYR